MRQRKDEDKENRKGKKQVAEKFQRNYHFNPPEYKKSGEKIIHWLPVQKDLTKAEILMPDKEVKKGLAEPLAKNLKVGDIIQCSRFGFCKLDKKEKDRLRFWYTHD